MNIIKFIIGFCDKNRKLIIMIIAIIVFLFVIIPMLNKFEGERQKRQYEKEQANKAVLTEAEKNLPTESIIGAGSVSMPITKHNFNIVKQFVEKCNNKDIQGAYDMLTDGCKKALYQTKEEFERGYYNMTFSIGKLVDMEYFISTNNLHTYYVKFYDDILSTGKIRNANYYNDYITIDENGKLSINSLIYRQEMNKTKEVNGVKITILAQEVYKDYEKYEIKIDNTTPNTILIDTREKSNSLCLVADNAIKYNSNIAEIAAEDRIIESNNSRTYKITFYKMFSTQAISKAIMFTDIVPNYQIYIKNPKSTNRRIQISIVI